MGRKRSRSRNRSGNSGVSRRAVLGLVLAGGAGLAGAQQTGAFSSVTGDRGFDVQTAKDKDALLGIQRRDPTGSDGDEVPLFTLTNRFDGPLTVEVTRVSVVSSGAFSLGRDDITEPGLTIGPSRQANVLATLSCDSSTSGDVELELTASTDDESVELTRVTTVTCRSEGPDRCPVVPQVSVSVPEDASPTLTESQDIDLKNTKVDGDVTTTDGSGGNIKLNNVDLTGTVSADGSVGELKNSAVGSDVRADGNINSVFKTNVGGDVLTAPGNGGNIKLKKSTVAGTVEADGSVGELKDTTVGGNVLANGNIGSVSNAEVGGDLKTASQSGGNIKLNHTIVCGAVDADGQVGEIKQTQIGGDTRSNGDVTISTSSSRIFGKITAADSNVTVKGGASVEGSIDAGGNVTVTGDGGVGRNITTGDDVTIGGSATVGGTIETDSNVKMTGTAVVRGDVIAGGNVTIEGNAVVEGTITADGSVTKNGNSNQGNGGNSDNSNNNNNSND